MIEKILFATNNKHKLKEVREISGKSIEICGLQEVGFEGEVPETQTTLEGNAKQKARFIYEHTGLNCFADDTGLEIDALDGRPGVYSARYAGEACSFEDNIVKVLAEMEGKSDRNARFRCVVCLILDGKEYLFEGKIEGSLLTGKRGSDGFGYDPLFVPEGQAVTFAEMAPYLKNGISHRGRAINKMLRYLANNT
jgi:XTP/dITP diphosphohydrolase